MTRLPPPGSTVPPETPELSWVLPLYRTARQLDELLARVHATAASMAIRHEVILVDDACPEGCGELAEAAAAADRRLRVLRLPRNRGQDLALDAGLKQARGRWCVVLDADLQDPPEAVVRMWAARRADLEAVFARRTDPHAAPGRRLTSRLYRSAVRLFGRLPPGAGLFALLSRDLVDRIAELPARGDDLLARIAAARPRATSIPVEREARKAGRSSYGPIRRATKAARSLWRMTRDRRPGSTTAGRGSSG